MTFCSQCHAQLPFMTHASFCPDKWSEMAPRPEDVDTRLIRREQLIGAAYEARQQERDDLADKVRKAIDAYEDAGFDPRVFGRKHSARGEERS